MNLETKICSVTASEIGSRERNKRISGHTRTGLFSVELNFTICSGAELALNLKEIHPREVANMPFKEPKHVKDSLPVSCCPLSSLLVRFFWNSDFGSL